MKKVNGTVHFTSFTDAAAFFGCRKVSMVTKDKEKLIKQRERFSANHKCRACGNPMTLIKGTNIFACRKCDGIKIGPAESPRKIPSYDLLDERGAEIANNIFYA